MVSHCCSAHRCGSIACATCTWRYSLVVARRILCSEHRSLHVVTIACAASLPGGVRRWRKSVHNVVAHQRRQCRWWRTFGIWAWCDGTGARGVVSLGSVTTTEFTIALRRHGALLARPIEVENIRAEVYAAAMSISSASAPRGAGRYQPFKIAIGPVATPVFPTSSNITRDVQPTAILL